LNDEAKQVNQVDDINTKSQQGDVVDEVIPSDESLASSCLCPEEIGHRLATGVQAGFDVSDQGRMFGLSRHRQRRGTVRARACCEVRRRHSPYVETPRSPHGAKRHGDAEGRLALQLRM
jgi:hypothetical protein